MARSTASPARSDRIGAWRDSPRDRSGSVIGAQLCRDASRFQVNELGIGGPIEEFDRLREHQQRRCCKNRVRYRHDGADGAAFTVMGSSRRPWRGLDRRRRLRRGPVKISERQRQQNGKRNKRRPRAISEIRSKPLHAGTRPVAGTNWFQLEPWLNFAGIGVRCQPLRAIIDRSSINAPRAARWRRTRRATATGRSGRRRSAARRRP